MARLAPLLAAGFAAQVLLGALPYLVPMAMGGGPAPVRAANAALGRAGGLRIGTINAALVACALPVPQVVTALGWALAIAGLAAFIPLLLLAVYSARPAKRPATVGKPRGNATAALHRRSQPARRPRPRSRR